MLATQTSDASQSTPTEIYPIHLLYHSSAEQPLALGPPTLANQGPAQPVPAQQLLLQSAPSQLTETVSEPPSLLLFHPQLGELQYLCQTD